MTPQTHSQPLKITCSIPKKRPRLSAEVTEFTLEVAEPTAVLNEKKVNRKEDQFSGYATDLDYEPSEDDDDVEQNSLIHGISPDTPNDKEES